MVYALLSLRIALHFIRGRKHNGIISLISILSTIGIALGVAVLIIGLSAMNGFERELRNRILAVVPHGEIEAVNKRLKEWPSLLRLVEKVPGILAAAPYINFIGLIENGVQLCAVQFKGVSPQQETQLSSLPLFVQSNAWIHFHAGEQQVILGHGVADAVGVKQGDDITVMLPNSNPELKLLQPKGIHLHVTGIIHLSGQLDHSLALVPLEDAQRYLDIGNSVTGIAIKVSQVFAADTLVRNAGIATNAHVYIKSWISDYGDMYRDIQLIRTIIYLSMILVIGVACFNIVSILVMVVRDKSEDIAVLRTLGAEDSLIRGIFIWYGMFAGLVGSLSGIVIGISISLQLTTITNTWGKIIGYSFLPGDIYFIDFLPSELHYLDVLIVLATVLFLSLLSSWYPTRRALRIEPARVLSGI